MSFTTAQKWRRTLAWLHRNFPAQYPITVRSRPTMRKFAGYTEYYPRVKFHIRINRKQSYCLRIDTLIHEWAHCLSWLGAGRTEEHSAEWGLAYARIYRTFIEWNYGREEREDE